MIVGIVGKPNVGKSAFFRSLTLAEVPSGNFPFTTIEANKAVGYVKVKDPALDFGKKSNPRDGYVLGDFRFIPIEIIDVAGLVPGAHLGKGLGNKFLDDLRQADVLIHIIDLSGSTNERGESVALNSYEPKKDVLFLEEELNFWFYNILKKNWASIEKKIKTNKMKLELALETVLCGLAINEDTIKKCLIKLSLNNENIYEKLFDFAVSIREISKPLIIAANKCDVLIDNNLWKENLEKLKKDFPNHFIIPVASEYEYNLKKASKLSLLNYVPGSSTFKVIDEKISFEQKKGLGKISSYLEIMKTTGVQETLDKSVFEILKLKPIFPGGSKLEDNKGNVLPDCFLMEEKATALDFAFKLHTDFGKNFVQAINIKKKIPVSKESIYLQR